jgi:hypothetical protein
MTPEFNVSSRDSVGVVGQIDLNSFNSNYDGPAHRRAAPDRAEYRGS